MASPRRGCDRDLIQEINRDGPRFAFYQAVRIVASAGERCALPATLRFRTPATLAFPASEVARVTIREPDDDAKPTAEMEVNFLGLTGPSGALPAPYTELLIERAYLHRDRSAHAFFDLFSHRAISHFYHAWRKYRFTVDYEQGARDGFTKNLLDWIGVGITQLRAQLGESAPLPERFMAYHAGLLAQKPISASALAALARGLFRVPVQLKQFVGHWVALPSTEQTRIGSQACQLGVSSVAGSRIWDQQTKLRFVIGPLTREQYRHFLPGQSAATALTRLAQFCVGHAMACDVQLILKRHDVPLPKLNQDRTDELQLGFNTWLIGATPDVDRADSVFAALK